MKIFSYIIRFVLLSAVTVANAQTDSTEYMRGYAAGLSDGTRTDIETALCGCMEDPVAQKVITNVRMLGGGVADILDTYISPEKYHGKELRYVSHTTRMREWGTRVSRRIVHQGSFSHATNRSGDGDEIAGMYSFGYGAHYNWQFLGGDIRINAGAMLDVNAGFMYNTRNGNNPAQARLSVALSPSAAAMWRFRVWNRPFSMYYEVSAPLAGVMFSPHYGQSYYEIFTRGDYDHNIVPTTIVSTPSLRQMLAIDFTLCRTTFRVGWLGDWQQSNVNNIKYHFYSNMLVIGIVRRFKLTGVAP